MSVMIAMAQISLESESECENYGLKLTRKRGRDVELVVGFFSVRRRRNEREKNIRVRVL